jgi:hypothetical protein
MMAEGYQSLIQQVSFQDSVVSLAVNTEVGPAVLSGILKPVGVLRVLEVQG